MFVKGDLNQLEDTLFIDIESFQILYHENCMDGLAAAYAASQMIEKVTNATEYVLTPCQYNDDVSSKLVKFEKFGESNRDKSTLIVVDFSFDTYLLDEVFEKFGTVVIVDHHKTAYEKWRNIEGREGLYLYFDMDRSGALLAYDLFVDDVISLNTPEMSDRIYFEYVSDRDLWQWKLPFSKEVNEALSVLVDRDNPDSFGEIIEEYSIEELRELGEDYIKAKEVEVARLSNKGWKPVVINGVEFLMRNVTSYISEVGNNIVKTRNKPACLYQVLDNGEVLFSLRSADNLADVGEVAKAMGGGGHRNAPGFAKDINFLIDLILQES